MRVWDNERKISTGESWAQWRKSIDEELRAEREYAATPAGRLDAAYRRLDAQTTGNDGWGTPASKDDIAETVAEIEALKKEMGRI